MQLPPSSCPGLAAPGEALRLCGLGRWPDAHGGARARLKGGFGACPSRSGAGHPATSGLLSCLPKAPAQGLLSGCHLVSDGTAQHRPRQGVAMRSVGRWAVGTETLTHPRDRALGPRGKGHSSWELDRSLRPGGGGLGGGGVPALLCLGVRPSLVTAGHRGAEGNMAAPTPRPAHAPPLLLVPRCPQVPCWEAPGASGTCSCTFQKGDRLPQGPGGSQAPGCPSASATDSMRARRCGRSPAGKGGREPRLPEEGQAQVAAF